MIFYQISSIEKNKRRKHFCTEGRDSHFHWNRPWCWERLKAGGEEDKRGWDDWMASPTWWTWVWASSRSWWWTQDACCAVVHGVAKNQTQLSNWTELNWKGLSGDERAIYGMSSSCSASLPVINICLSSLPPSFPFFFPPSLTPSLPSFHLCFLPSLTLPILPSTFSFTKMHCILYGRY